MVEFRIRRNPAVTSADLIAMHLKPYKPPHLLPVPTTIPEIEIATPHPRVVRLKFREGAARRLGKPAGVHGLECLWVMTETPPTHPSGVSILHKGCCPKGSAAVPVLTEPRLLASGVPLRC
jgi:hypothetical protein